MTATVKGPWSPRQIEDFLGEAVIPMRLAAVRGDAFPQVVSVWFRYRDHYSSCAWNAYVTQINEIDSATAYPNRIEWVPPLATESWAFGGIYIAFQPDDGTPYFTRVPLLFADGFESGDTSAWSVTGP